MFAALSLQLKSTGILMLSIKVRPSAHHTRVKGVLADGTIKIDIAAVPEDGKANEELVRFLAGELGVGKGNVELVSGHTAARKVVRIYR